MGAETKTYSLTNQIFVCIGQAISGPFSLAEAKQWAETNGHRHDAFVWCEGFPNWFPVSLYQELKPLPKAPPPITVNQLSSLKQVTPIQTDEPTVTSFTTPGFAQPWTYPSSQEATQVTQVTRTVNTQYTPSQVAQPVQHHTQPVQQQIVPTVVIRQSQPVQPSQQTPATSRPSGTTYAPPSPKLPERKKIPVLESVPFDPSLIKNNLFKGAQILGVFALLGVAYIGATHLPMKEFANYVQNLAKKSQPVVAPPAPEVKVAAVQPAATAKRDPKTYDAAAIQRTISKMVSFESPVERAAKSRNFQRNFESLSPDGKFWKENVPLGIKLTQLKGALSECQLEKPEGAAGFWPLTSYDPPIRDFFPLKEGVYKGLSIYFGWVGGLASRHAEHFEMRCSGEETFDLFFNRTSKTLFAYAKTITLTAPTSLNAIEQVEVEMAKYCNGPVQAHKAVARDRRSGNVDVHVRYCQYADMIIVAASDAIATAQNSLAQVNLAYVSGKGWKEYLTAVENQARQRMPAAN
jgi:hypothetical protein